MADRLRKYVLRAKVLAFVMAGGEGSRLHPLTADRCKPAVPFNGKHTIVDFVLSNLVNSEIYSIYLLVHNEAVRHNEPRLPRYTQ